MAASKKLCSIITSAVLVFALFGLHPALKVSAYGAGDGTVANPYIITTPAELDTVRDDLTAHYKLGADIDLTGYLSPGNAGYNAGAGWEPVASWYPAFSGTFDGNGHKIMGLWINRGGADVVGLFGHIDGGTVKNLAVEVAGAGVKGRYETGGVTGCISNGTVENCRISGNVSGKDMVGGLIGYSGGSNSYVVNVSNCYSTSVVSADSSNVGGLIGFSSGSGVIERCYAAGNVTAGYGFAGGLVGSSNGETIRNCYAVGNVTGIEGIGGLVGGTGGYGASKIANCYAVGSVSGTYSAGGLVGSISSLNGASMSDCFFDTQTSGQTSGVGSGSSAGAAGKTTAEMKTKSTFTDAGWDFATIWGIKENISYPYFLVESRIIYKNYDGSDITALDPAMPTTYTESVGMTLPSTPPSSDMDGWTFLGYWDCPLDPSKTVTIPGPGHGQEKSLDFTAGHKITAIPDTATGNITLYARYTSDTFDEDVNARENYIFAAPGVFPNGAKASVTELKPGTAEYEATLKAMDEKNIDKIKIVEMKVFDAHGNQIQPNTFFGHAAVGFRIPADFSVNDTTLKRIVVSGTDVKLGSKTWTDPADPGVTYIEGYTDHFSTFAIVTPATTNNPQTGDGSNPIGWLIALLMSMMGLLGILVWGKRQIPR
ncbi:MAG: hypothetical protein FWC62_04590 [Firmicutes bacterium]|nr:hypothetical protein [Bacillota bacterium]